MFKQNEVCVRIKGDRAMFAQPHSKSSGNPITYDIPTASAIVGVLNAFYSHPHVRWVVDKVRVVNSYDNKFKITNTYGCDGGANMLSTSVYLNAVDYIVLAHLEIVKCDAKYTNKYDMTNPIGVLSSGVHQFVRSVNNQNPHRTPYLGRAECSCEVKMCKLDIDTPMGYYKEQGTRYFPNVFLGFKNYSDEKSVNCARDRYFSDLTMVNGLIEYPNLLDENLKRYDRIG